MLGIEFMIINFFYAHFLIRYQENGVLIKVAQYSFQLKLNYTLIYFSHLLLILFI
jgi:uncharacterized protein HemY